ncbi:MAG: sugar kinase [Coprobacillaceae bacterium]
MKILAFGEVMMRLMPPDYKRLTQTNHLEYLFSGTGVNVLSGLYQMGDQPYFTTVLPDNAVGNAAAAHIRKLGIRDDFISYKGDHIGIYVLEKGLGNRPSQVTYLNRKESSFGKSNISNYDIDSILEGMEAIHICGISLAISHEVREVAYQFAKKAKEKGLKIIFDCNFRSSLWNEEEKKQVKDIYEKMLYLADVVFAGYKDATLLLNMPVDKELAYIEQIRNVLQDMCSKYNIEIIFGTNREHRKGKDYIQGYYVTATEGLITELYPLTIYDRVGGGDGFAVGAIHAYMHNYEEEKMIEFATLSGVLAHTTYGDSPIVSKAEILNIIENGYCDIQR